MTRPTIEVAGATIEYVDLPGSEPALVLLHEGLGCVDLWRQFPEQLHAATGRRTVAYSRPGYGRSTPVTPPWPVTYMHDQARSVLPAVLDRLGVAQPVLVGHSDGASIALIHAGAGHPVTGIVAMAPHVFVEDVSIASIAAAREAYRTTPLRERLARYHADVDSAFWGWNRIWLHPDFRAWNIEACLPRIACPILGIQGEDDEYGTMEQLHRIARGAPDVELVKLGDCRHSPHRDQPDAVLDAIARFVDRVSGD